MVDEFDSDTGELFPVPDKGTNVPFFRSAYNYDRDAVSLDTGLRCEDASLAQQHMAEDADINEIVRRFGITGQMPENVRLPQYGDFTGVSDYRSALDAVREADNAFMELPADLRAKFDNDPQLYLDFATDPANQEKLYELGLAERRQAPITPMPNPTGSTGASSDSAKGVTTPNPQ